MAKVFNKLDFKLVASHLLIAGVTSLLTYCFTKRKYLREEACGCEGGPEVEAGWLAHLYQDKLLENVDAQYREWTDEKWRGESGWKGTDFIHARKSRGPRIIQYFFNRESQMLIGIVKFGPASESHQGLCHGGSMTAVLDDVLGHTAFVSGNGPWTGATIQVNCTLKKPVVIGER
jgi:hypothetical protein